MKIRTKKSQLKASRIFTDREEPRAAFWQQYRRLEEEIAQEEANVHVLTYYGIGGIGKSSLLKKIMEEMDERVEDPLYVYFDFNLQQESRHVLDALKNKLAESCKFEFPLYELGAYIYAKKVGENPDAPEVKPLLKKSPAVELLLNIAGEIPVVGSATKILDLAEKGVAAFRGYLQEHRKELRQIEYMEAEELYDYLPSLFAEDMTHAMEKCDAPLVILLDTYERLVNEMSSTGEPLSKDVWLRGEDGLVQNVPGVLWVIAGREKLKWERFDSEWKEALEQHLLGSLSSQDSDQFLLAAGVADAALRSDLYGLTMGTPVYLDLCVDQYRRLVERGAEPRAEMFGRDTFDLIERFARYMDDAQKDIVYVLSCMGHWNDSEIAAIARQVIPGFSITTYEKVKGLSFITQSDDGDYNIHQTVGEVLLESCPALLRGNTARCGLEHFGAVLQEAGIMEARYAEALGYCVRFAIMLHKEDDDALWETCSRLVVEPLRRINFAGGFAQTESILDPLVRHAQERPGTRFFGNVYAEYSRVLRAKGDFFAALAASEKAWNCLCACLGKEHEDTLRCGFVHSCSLWELGRRTEMIELDTFIYETSLKILGEDHPDTLRAMRALALDYSNFDRDDEALELNTRAIEKMLRVHGPTHRETLLTMGNQANYLKYVGRKEEALEMIDKVLAVRREMLGDSHPDTLTSMANKAGVLKSLGRHEEALALRRTIREKRVEVLGKDHPRTLDAVSALANQLNDLKRYEEALPLYREVYEGRREVLGEEHKDTASAANNLAYCCRDLGLKEETEQYFRIAAVRYRVLYGEKAPTALWALNDWADALYNLGRYEEALPLYMEAYEGRREVLGEKDKKTLTSANDIAFCLRDMGRREESLEYYRIVAEGRRETLGATHSSTLWSVNVWAEGLQKLGRREEALPLCREVYEGYRNTLGEKHLTTIAGCVRLGDTLYGLKRYEEALPLYREAYESRREVLGEQHKDTASSANDLAYCCRDLDLKEEAERYFRITAESYRALYGEKAPTALWALNDWADALYALERYEEALPLYMEAYEGRREVLGEKDQKTLTSANDIAYCLRDMDRREESLEYYRIVVEGRREVLGATHSSTLWSLSAWAAVLYGLERYEEALPLYRQLCEDSGSCYGRDHARTIDAMERLAFVLSRLGRREEALDTYYELAKICHEDPEKRDRELLAVKNVSIVLWNMGRKEEARELCRLLVQDYTDFYGVDNLRTAAVVDLYHRMGGE